MFCPVNSKFGLLLKLILALMHYSCNTCTMYIYTGLCYNMNVIVCLSRLVREGHMPVHEIHGLLQAHTNVQAGIANVG